MRLRVEETVDEVRVGTALVLLVEEVAFEGVRRVVFIELL